MKPRVVQFALLLVLCSILFFVAHSSHFMSSVASFTVNDAKTSCNIFVSQSYWLQYGGFSLRNSCGTNPTVNCIGRTQSVATVYLGRVTNTAGAITTSGQSSRSLSLTISSVQVDPIGHTASNPRHWFQGTNDLDMSTFSVWSTDGMNGNYWFSATICCRISALVDGNNDRTAYTGARFSRMFFFLFHNVFFFLKKTIITRLLLFLFYFRPITFFLLTSTPLTSCSH